MSRSEWAYAELHTVATLRSGGTPSKSRSEYWGDHTPWITAKDMRSMRIDESNLKLSLDPPMEDELKSAR